MAAFLDLTVPAGPSAPRAPLVVLPGGRSRERMAVVHRRRRLVAAALGCLLLVTAAVGVRALATAIAPSPPGSGPPVTVAAGVPSTSVVVAPGDTLWAIARRMRPEGEIRSLVDRLADAHGPGPLLPGERLVLEAAGAGPAR